MMSGTTTTDRSAAFLQLCQRHPHLAMTALMGTAKHLREVHGLTDVPTDPHELARLHVKAHARQGARIMTDTSGFQPVGIWPGTGPVSGPFEGDLVQIDYRADGTIEALHAQDRAGETTVIRLEMPAEGVEEIAVGQRHVLFMDPARRPVVRIDSPGRESAS